MRPAIRMAVALATGVHAQTTVTVCESYSYTDTITFTEYTTYYVTPGATGDSRTTTTSFMNTSLTSFTLPPASSTSNTNTNDGIGGSRSTTTMTSSATGVPGNGTSVIIPGDEDPVTPSTPIPTSPTTTTVSTTITAPSSITTTDPGVTSSSFYIVFDVPTSTPAARRLSKRAAEYLSFDDEGQSILVTSEADAAVFSLDQDGSLKSGSQYVAFDEAAEPPRFNVQDEKPESPVEVIVDASGNVSIPGVEDFCLQGDDLVVLTGDAGTPGDCQAVEVELVAAGDETTTTTSALPSSTSISDVAVATTTSGTELTSSISTSTTSPDASTTPVIAETTTNAESTSSSEATTTVQTTTMAEPTTTSESTSSSSSAASTISTSIEPGVTNKAYIDTILRHHNRHRANHTVDPLVWDVALAETSKKIADGCVYAHDTATDCPPDENGNPQACYGQNIGAGYLPVQMGSIITDGFYNGEVNYYTYYDGEPDTSTLHFWGHFSQIVWKDTESVGCYTTDCSASGLGNIDPSSGIRPFFTVCNYGPPGNWLDEFAANVIEPLNFETIGADYECPTADNCEDGS